MFDNKFYDDKINKLEQKKQRIMQEYINNGLKFGQEIAEINQDIQDIQKLIKENTPKEEKVKK